MEYTDYEKEKIREAFNVVMDDLDEIWQESNKEEIRIPVSIDAIKIKYPDCPTHGWQLVMNKKGFFIECDTIDCLYRLFLQKSTLFKKPIRKLKNYSSAIEFVKKYPKIRESVLKELSLQKAQKNSESDIRNNELTEIDKIKEIYSHTVCIELSSPSINSQYQFELTNEEGLNIGTIQIGNTTLKVITNNAIKLVTPTQDYPKVKQK